MKRLIKATTYLSIGNLIEMVARFARSKAIATFLGAAGTGFLAQIGFFFELLRVTSGFGTRRSIMKHIGELRDEPDFKRSEAYGRVLTSATVLQIVLSATVSTLVTVFRNPISQALFNDPGYGTYVAATGWILPVASFSMLLGSILKAHQAFQGFAKATIAGNLTALVISPVLVWKFGLAGGIASLYLFYGMPLLAYIYSALNRRGLYFSKTVDGGLIRDMMFDGTNTFYQLALSNMIRVIIASWVTGSYGMDRMGIYQSVLTLTSVYMAIPIQSMGGYTVPVITAAKTRDEVDRAMNDSFRLLAIVLIPMLTLIAIFPEAVLDLLYAREFVVAAPILRWQLLGVVFEIVNFSMGSVLVAKARYRALYIASTLHGIAYMSLSWYLFRHFELTGLAWAFAASTGGIAVFLMIYNAAIFKVYVSPKNLRLLGLLLTWLALGYAVGLTGSVLMKILTLLSGPAFLWAGLNGSERTFLMDQLKAKVFGRFGKRSHA